MMKSFVQEQKETAAACLHCYDHLSIRLHWITAGLVGLLWSVAQVIDYFPRGEPRVAVRSVHIILGALLALVLLTRVYWRIGHGRRLPRTTPGVLGLMGQAMHFILYGALAATILLGAANVWVRGDTVTGLFSVRPIRPGDDALKSLVEWSHANFANAVVVLASLHAAAAVIHHVVLRDDVLYRMLPRIVRRRQKPIDRV